MKQFRIAMVKFMYENMKKIKRHSSELGIEQNVSDDKGLENIANWEAA